MTANTPCRTGRDSWDPRQNGFDARMFGGSWPVSLPLLSTKRTWTAVGAGAGAVFSNSTCTHVAGLAHGSVPLCVWPMGLHIPFARYPSTGSHATAVEGPTRDFQGSTHALLLSHGCRCVLVDAVTAARGCEPSSTAVRLGYSSCISNAKREAASPILAFRPAVSTLDSALRSAGSRCGPCCGRDCSR